ncbi:MAG: hypothetical protein ACFFDQ_02825 [Candidatus Thorarchaeota archaeon]
MGNHKIILFVLVLGFIFLSNQVGVTHASQADDFPIGMYLQYHVYNEIPPSTFEYNIRYDFIQWIDRESLLIKYEKDSVTNIAPLPGIRLISPDLPPLWMDVSLLQLGQMIEISGTNYDILIKEDYFLPGYGYYECFRLEYIIQENGRENASSLWYHGQLGILCDYLRVDMDIEANEMIEALNVFVLESNFNQYSPPTFTTTTSTTTTATTVITTTSPTSTTSPTQTTSSGMSTTTPATVSPIILTEILGLGIIIEIIIIVVLLQRKR